VAEQVSWLPTGSGVPRGDDRSGPGAAASGDSDRDEAPAALRALVEAGALGAGVWRS
jgi:hypothetical protein